MKTRVRAVAACVLVMIAGCASRPEGAIGNQVPVRVVVNSLKCDLARYFAYERANLGLPFILEGGSPVEAILTLNVVDQQVAGAGASVDPSVLSFGSGGGIGLGLSGSVKQTITTVRKTTIQLTPTAADTSICENAGDDLLVNGIGIYNWLVDVRRDMRGAVPGSPLALVDKLQYSSEFGVEKKVTGTASFIFVPLKGNLELTQSRSDVQKLEVTVNTKKQAKSGGKRKGKGTGNAQKLPPCNPKIETCPFSTQGSAIEL